MKKLRSLADLDEALTHDTFVLLKHSVTCSISAQGYNQVAQFEKKHKDIPIFVVMIQEHRDVSNAIAEKTGVTHESPQILLFKDGELIADFSHYEVTVENLCSTFGLKN